MRSFMTLAAVLLSFLAVRGQVRHVIVADSLSHQPLSSASVFDNQGKVLGISNNKGRLPYIPSCSYPITVRYLGFQEKIFEETCGDTIFLQEIPTELPEVLVISKHHKVLHILGYVREYSTLTTYTDTVFLFREKMVDFMLIPDSGSKFTGWRTPRVLKSKSYYHFTNSQGLDSVSKECQHHFSWSDWLSIVPSPEMPSSLSSLGFGTDTIYGKYGPTEVWIRNDDKLSVDINILADTTSRKWVPNLSGFFRNGLDYEIFRTKFNYDNVIGDSIAITDITGYSFNIESNGRGHDMFRFNRINEPFYVTTYAEVYILDKEFITVKEAKKWENWNFDLTDVAIIEPAEAPPLQPPIRQLVTRVNAINPENVRLNFTPDHRLMGREVHKQNLGQRAFTLLKEVTGISLYKSRKNFNRRWNDFRKEQMQKNNSRPY